MKTSKEVLVPLFRLRFMTAALRNELLVSLSKHNLGKLDRKNKVQVSIKKVVECANAYFNHDDATPLEMEAIGISLFGEEMVWDKKGNDLIFMLSPYDVAKFHRSVA